MRRRALLLATLSVAASLGGGGEATAQALSVLRVADTAPLGAGDWREADRILIRIPTGRLGTDLPRLVLGWKDRTLQNDPDGELPRRSSHLLPLGR